jgi:hypothetical protein
MLTAAATHPPALGLASNFLTNQQRGQRGNSRHRTGQLATPLQEAPLYEPPPFHFGVVLAVGEWPTPDALEVVYSSLETVTHTNLASNALFSWVDLYYEFLAGPQRIGLKAATRSDSGEWLIAINHATKQKPLIFFNPFAGRQVLTQIIRDSGWPTAKDSGNTRLIGTWYPVTLCWKPKKDEAEFNFDSHSVQSLIRFQATSPHQSPAPVEGEEDLPDMEDLLTPRAPPRALPLAALEAPPPLAAAGPSSVVPSTSAAAAPSSHRRGISEVTSRGEREDEHAQERPRKVLETSGGTQNGEGRVTRSGRRQKAPTRADGDVLQ